MLRTWVEINKRALKNNLGQFKQLIGKNVDLMAVVKSNAYGHGLVEVAKAVKNDVNWFGVDSIDEAIALKKAGIKSPVLIMGYTLKSRLKDVVKNGFRQVVYNLETVKTLAHIASALKKTAKIHLKLETGTSRQGLEKLELFKLARQILKYPQIKIEGIYTHYANIEDTTNHIYAYQQLKKFKETINLLGKNNIQIPVKHTACTAATILFPETYFSLVRIGIGLYGLWPSKETLISAQEKKIKLNLKPVLSWKTRIAQIKKINAGMPVGYGLTEKVLRNSKIAVLPVGYFDGYDWRLSGVGNVLIRGKRCKILGRVCMNMMMIDVSHISELKPEEEVVILGKQKHEEITAEEIAKKTGTINYEVVTGINSIIPRIIK